MSIITTNQIDEIVTTSRAHIQKTISQLLSFRMRAHGVYRNTRDKPLISVATTQRCSTRRGVMESEGLIGIDTRGQRDFLAAIDTKVSFTCCTLKSFSAFPSLIHNCAIVIIHQSHLRRSCTRFSKHIQRYMCIHIDIL